MKGVIHKILITLLAVSALICVALGIVACQRQIKDSVTVTLISETLEKKEVEAKPGDPLPVLSVEDRDFEGYWTDSGYQVRYENDVVPDKNVTLYYKLNLQYYNLVLDYGTSGQLHFQLRRGVNEKLPDIAPMGSLAVGFSKTEDGEADFLLGDTVKNLAEKGGTATLYARYEVKDAGDYTIENGTVVAYNGKSTSLTLPLGATKIAAGVFTNNKNSEKVTSLIVPATYKEIACGAFEGLTALESLTVPFIGGSRTANRFLAYTFGAKKYDENTYSFAGYTDGSSLYMGDQHFENQVLPLSLKTVRVTEKTKEFAEGAFYSAYALENVVLDYPEALDKVGKSAFENCISFGYNAALSIAVSPAWLRYVSTIGEAAFKSYTGNTESSVKVIYPYGEQLPSYTATLITYAYPFNSLKTIPKLENIVSVGNEAFYFAAALDSLEFGNKLKTIGERSFAYTLSVSGLKFPDSLESIGNFAFALNGALNIEFGTGITYVGVMAFEECSNLSEVVFKGTQVPELDGKQCFSNTLTDNGSDGYNIGFDSFRIYVPTAAAEEYLLDPDWAEYTSYIYTATGSRAPAYWSKDGSSWDAKFEFTDGSIVFVTDPEQKFISEIDYLNFGEMTYGATCGTYYPMMYEFIDAETYAKKALGKNAGTHAKELYENQTLLHLWHPELVSYDGTVLDDLYFMISDLPYGYEGSRVALPVLEKTGYKNADFGSATAEGSYVIGTNAYGVPQLNKVMRDGAFYYLDAIPDPAGTFYSRMTDDDISYTFTYFDKDYKVIDEKVFVRYNDVTASWSSPIYPKSEDYVTLQTNAYYNNSNELYLDGRGGAIVSIENGKVKYNCSVIEDSQKKFGEEGYTVRLVQFKSDGTAVSGLDGSAVFRDYMNGNYSCIDLTVGEFSYTILNVTYDSGWYRYTYDYVSSVKIHMPEYSTDVNDDFWRYTRLSTVEVLGNISIYIVSFDEKETIAAAYYREYDEVNNMISFGTVEYGAGAEFSITDSDGNTRTAQTKDNRGSFKIGEKNYIRYDDSEDMTLVLTENFYGTLLYYYTVKTDGYGNMYILDEHDDDICDMYVGTYDDYNGFVSNGASYYELMFSGVKVDKKGEPVSDETVNMWILYDFGTLSAWSDEDSDAQWYGQIASIYTDHEETVVSAYDDFGYKLFDLTVDIYGNTEYVQYSYVLDIKGNVTYKALEKGDVEYFISVTNATGDVLYFIAFDSNGNAMYSIRREEGSDQFVIVRDGGQFIESGVRRYVVVETEDLKKLSEDGASFGKL